MDAIRCSVQALSDGGSIEPLVHQVAELLQVRRVPAGLGCSTSPHVAPPWPTPALLCFPQAGLVGSRLAANLAEVIAATTRSAALVLEPTFERARLAAGPSSPDAFARAWIQQVGGEATES